MAELFTGFNDWSAAVGSTGIQVAYAVIAANWAVHGSTQAIVSNGFAKWSMAIVVGFLGLNVVLTAVMAKLYRERCEYADADKRRWESEFAANAAAASPWPYTSKIQHLGETIRTLKVVAPVASGFLFVASLF